MLQRTSYIDKTIRDVAEATEEKDRKEEEYRKSVVGLLQNIEKNTAGLAILLIYCVLVMNSKKKYLKSSYKTLSFARYQTKKRSNINIEWL